MIVPAMYSLIAIFRVHDTTMGEVLLSVKGIVAVAVMMTAAPLSMRINGGPGVVLDAVMFVASRVQFVG